MRKRPYSLGAVREQRATGDGRPYVYYRKCMKEFKHLPVGVYYLDAKTSKRVSLSPRMHVERTSIFALPSKPRAEK